MRALAAGAWAHPEWNGVTPVGAEAERAVGAVGLERLRHLVGRGHIVSRGPGLRAACGA